MSPRTIVLGALAALVAAGGVYLMIEVRSSGAAPPEVAVKQAQDRHARVAAVTSRAPQIEDVGAGAASARPRDDRPVQPQIDRRIANAMRNSGALAPDPAEAADPAVNPDFDAAMLEANKLYDRHNYDEARTLALKLLERQPGTVRMLRVVVSSSCILGDADTSQKYWAELPEFDRGQMSTRCARFGISFTP